MPPSCVYPPFLKTESRWDDTGYDVTAYDVLTDFNEPNDTAAAGGVIEVLKFVFILFLFLLFPNQKQTVYLLGLLSGT